MLLTCASNSRVPNGRIRDQLSSCASVNRGRVRRSLTVKPALELSSIVHFLVLIVFHGISWLGFTARLFLTTHRLGMYI